MKYGAVRKFSLFFQNELHELESRLQHWYNPSWKESKFTAVRNGLRNPPGIFLIRKKGVLTNMTHFRFLIQKAMKFILKT